MKNLGINLLVFVLLVAFVGSLGEIYFRFFYDTTDSFALSRNTRLWFQKYYRYNNAGLRDSEDYAKELDPHRPRVTFLGDSFTAGHGIKSVEQRFANQIRKARPELEIQVLAKDGFDTGHQIRFLSQMKDQGLRWNRVALVYCLNDNSDLVPQWREELNTLYLGQAQASLLESSFLLNWLFFRWISYSNKNVANYYQFVKDHYQGETWETQKERLWELNGIVKKGGGKLLVVTFPFLHALGPNYPYRAIHKQLGEFWSEQNVPHLDLLSQFEPLDPTTLTVNAYDAHPNEEAHQLALNKIVGFLDAN